VDFLLPSSGLPPIPAQLVQAIKEGKFVHFRDLLPEALREHASRQSPHKDENKKKAKKFYISPPADWSLAFLFRCDGTLPAFQLAFYASIIMGLARDTRNPQVWIRYDRLFQQAVAVNPALEWH